MSPDAEIYIGHFMKNNIILDVREQGVNTVTSLILYDLKCRSCFQAVTVIVVK